MANKFSIAALAMVVLLALHAAAAARDLPKETLLQPKAVEPAAAPASNGKDDKHFIAFGGMGGVAGMGGVVGVLPIGDMGGLGGMPSGLGGLGGDPGGRGGVCGTSGGLAGGAGRKPVIPLVP